MPAPTTAPEPHMYHELQENRQSTILHILWSENVSGFAEEDITLDWSDAPDSYNGKGSLDISKAGTGVYSIPLTFPEGRAGDVTATITAESVQATATGNQAGPAKDRTLNISYNTSENFSDEIEWDIPSEAITKLGVIKPPIQVKLKKDLGKLTRNNFKFEGVNDQIEWVQENGTPITSPETPETLSEGIKRELVFNNEGNIVFIYTLYLKVIKLLDSNLTIEFLTNNE